MMQPDTGTFVGATNEDTRLLELDQRRADVLAIGSQLAYGHVGLNASQPVYQAAGLRVAAIPTTVLSVLPHYPSVHQTHLPVNWIASSLDDLFHSGALRDLRAIAIGYLATAAQANAVTTWLQAAGWLGRVPVVVDPTFGDIGLGFYNNPGIVSSVREILLPHATGLTPNVFELAHLTGIDPSEIHDLSSIEAAARQLFRPEMEWIVVTGIRASQFAEHSAFPAGVVSEFVLTRDSAESISHPLLEEAPAGVGDTFTASLICHLIDGAPVKAATRLAAAETAHHIQIGATR